MGSTNVSYNAGRLGKNFPRAKIKNIHVFQINKTLHVTKAFLAAFFDVTERNVVNWTDAGMPISDYSVKGSGGITLFDLRDVVKWKNNNVKSPTTKNAKKDKALEEDDSVGSRAAKADMAKKEEEAILARLKREQLEGTLVEAEDLAITQAEQAAIYKTNYINDKKVLRVLLANKSPEEIGKLLDDHFQKRLEELNVLVNRGFDEGNEGALYDIMEIVIDKLREGVKPDRITKIVEEME